MAVDVQALIEKQRAVVENLPSRECFAVFGGERVEVQITKLRSDAWADLIAAHPPRPGNELDREAGFNQKTLPGGYPVGSLLFGGEPVTVEQWAEIFPLLDTITRNQLVQTIYLLNILDPVRELLALGKVGQGGTSGSPANRESRRAASKGGNQRKSRATTTPKETSPEPQ